MLTLHPLFSHNAIVQADRPIVIEGTAPIGAPILVSFAGMTATGHASAASHWSVTFPAQPAGGPHEIVVESDLERIECTNLHLGDVWLCAGQSNMEWTLAMLRPSDREFTSSAGIRCFMVPRRAAASPQALVEGVWRGVDETTVQHVSAVGYYFAQQLHLALRRPIGIVVVALGGSAISAWLPQEALQRRTEYKAILASDTPPSFEPHRWRPRSLLTEGWEAAAFEPADWDILPVPGHWQTSGLRHNGAVWYRRTVSLPAGWAQRNLLLEFTGCNDFDETFVNGDQVGSTGPGDPNAFATPRRYMISGRLATGTRVTIAVRVFNAWGDGGLCGDVFLRPADGHETPLNLNGPWKAQVELALPLRTAGFIPPAGLYNAMIHPLTHRSFRGVLWYQGESDTRRAALYRLLLSDLIEAWRAAFGDPLLPFGIVQLPSYRSRSGVPVESDWAELRDAQLLATRSQPATGLAVTIDLGEADNVHPTRKQPVGDRLARWALATIHGLASAPWSGPIAIDHWRDGRAYRVRFAHVGRGLRARAGASLDGFQMAGADRKWVWAEARLVAPDIVHIEAVGIADPAAVRYAWQDNPPYSLENSAALPASPFRTDDWALLTRHT